MATILLGDPPPVRDLGWLAIAVFRELNGRRASRITNDDVVNLVIWIASSNPELSDIAERLGILTSNL
jgi:hypothetical protein